MSSPDLLQWNHRLGVFGVSLPAPFERYWISPLISGHTDEVALAEIFNDERMLSKLYRQPVPYSREYALSIIARNSGLEPFYEDLRKARQQGSTLPRIPDEFFGSLRDSERDDRVVATMDVSSRAMRPDKRFIGFFLSCDLSGQGIMSTAARRMIETLDAHNGQELIYGIARVDNPSSQAILRKLGFVEQERFDVTYPPDKGGVIRRVIEYARPAAG